MSRSSQVSIVESPVTKYLEWKNLSETIIVDGEEITKNKGASFVSYNKDTKVNVPLKLPIKFAILNPDLVTFKGYDDKSKTGYWSNEVDGDKRKGDPIVTVKNKNGIVMTFPLSEYKLNSAKLAGMGIKYVKSVYGALDTSNGWELVNFQIKGAAFSGAPEDGNNMTSDEKHEGWINFTKDMKGKMFKNCVEINGFKLKKKGATKFSIPVFEIGDEINEKTGMILDELDKTLNEYLTFYFNKPVEAKEVKGNDASVEKTETKEEISAAINDNDDNDLPF